jgi:hypothetical protein
LGEFGKVHGSQQPPCNKIGADFILGGLFLANPFNPLDWLKSAQDWFTRTERSSGFRPFLIYLVLAIGAGLGLLSFSKDRPLVEDLALILIGFPVLSFVPLFWWKAHSDPDFCRSETHVQRLKKIELEVMGTESQQIEGEVLEQTALITSIEEPPAIQHRSNDGGGG